MRSCNLEGFRVAKVGNQCGGSASGGTAGKVEVITSKSQRKDRQGVVNGHVKTHGLKCVYFNARTIMDKED